MSTESLDRTSVESLQEQLSVVCGGAAVGCSKVVLSMVAVIVVIVVASVAGSLLGRTVEHRDESLLCDVLHEYFLVINMQVI